MTNDKKVGLEPYKGVRDFYPEDMFIQNYIQNIMRKSAESFGYLEYSASLLEPTELFESKSGEEIVTEQMYTFEDRGGRRVALRPEMTPSLARMVAKRRRDYPLPIRWFTIANVFRYERPQRGRLREHWQLNADIFGVPGIEADLETISLAYQVMKNFDADDEDFEIKINDRSVLDREFEKRGIAGGRAKKLRALIDKKDKIENFEEESKKIAGEVFTLERSWKEASEVLDRLKGRGIQNAIYEPSVVRGFDYYTGIVFEVFDTSPKNNRSLFGGGRYDNLLEVFGEESIPAVGFGMGDVTMYDFLETHELLPRYVSSTALYICTTDKTYFEEAEALGSHLRKEGVSTAVNMTEKKVGEQIAYASKRSIPYVLCIGEEEKRSGIFTVKSLADGKEEKMDASMISSYLNTR
jgi:histidyl-tRNA synthetase